MLRNGVRLSRTVCGGDLSVSLMISESDLHCLISAQMFVPPCLLGVNAVYGPE